MKWISLLESFGSLLVTLLVTIVVAESSYKDFSEINGKFVGNIPGWDDAWSQVWCVGLKIWFGQEFCRVPLDQNSGLISIKIQHEIFPAESTGGI